MYSINLGYFSQQTYDITLGSRKKVLFQNQDEI